MAMEEPKVRINPAFLPFLEHTNTKSIDEDVNVSLAMYLLTADKLTLHHAAELAGKSLPDFIQILIHHNIQWGDYSEEHMKQDNDTIDYIIRETEDRSESDK